MAATEQELARAIGARLPAGWVVVPLEDGGFDVTRDLADATYLGLSSVRRRATVLAHRIRVEGDRFTMEDLSREVRWEAGAVRFTGSVSLTRGRIVGQWTETVYALGADGRVGPQVAYTVRLAETHDLIREVAAEAGLSERMPTSMRIGVVMAGGTVGLLVLAGVVLLVLWIAGAIP